MGDEEQVREINESSRSPGSKDNSTNPESVIAVQGANWKSTLPNKALDTCSIDIEDEDGVGENERVCRICHLGDGKSVQLMELGCRCKGELGAAHSHCAEAWFRVKGNRLCEICEAAATNVTGVGDGGFMDSWNQRSMADIGNNINTSDGSRGYLQGQPLCNLLMSFLVIAVIVPFFFRLNIL